MKKLLSLPPNLVGSFHDVERVSRDEYFCTNDPVGSKLGSGGGTTWLLEACYQEWGDGKTFQEWLGEEKRILLHAGGQSRRLPSYAPSGKILTPVPVFRWARGQRINQNLLSLQLPLYERIMKAAPEKLHTLIASGDVYIRAGKLQDIPEADVVCYGMWVDPSLAKNHGVFVSSREHPERLDYMLQKPSVETMGKLLRTHFFLMDVGIWLLSDKAVEKLRRKSIIDEKQTDLSGNLRCYDLYSEFGCSLGEHPTIDDPDLADLSVAILPLNDGEFYHFGTSRELISSTVAIQNLVNDQRAIMHYGVKPHPSIFIQNAHKGFAWSGTEQNIWIENAWIGEGWTLSKNNIITGVPQNDWNVALPDGICVDVVPIGETAYVLRPYGYNDSMAGALQTTNFYPVSDDVEQLGQWLAAFLKDGAQTCQVHEAWKDAELLSAEQISDRANLRRLDAQRRQFMARNLEALAKNHTQSVFYQTDLLDMARHYHEHELNMPEPLTENDALMKRISDQMFRSQLLRLRGEDGKADEQKAFELLREGLTSNVLSKRQQPKMNVYSDQIVWGRSPVRIDIAGGWTDTPPFCLTSGGSVVNLAIELNGQPPLQAYVKPCKNYKVILRSIDLGASEEVTTFDELADFAKVGSPFSIPKAALCLAGFHPRFAQIPELTLERQLQQFGCGIEVTLLSAIPAGSGLGTSSILAATVLGAVSDFCGLAWDAVEIANHTLVLEQLLTTGGGWQDQYGGVLKGVKLLRTQPGYDQTPEVRWMPDTLFTDPAYQPCHLLYYTGITRTAKNILSEIVRGMFLSDYNRLSLLTEMKEHTLDLYHAILAGRFEEMGRLVAKTWEQNKQLDAGTNPAAVASIIEKIHDLCLGYKLPGAGGGGYLYMIAKDAEAAARIRQTLTDERPNSCARFVDMTLSNTGLQVSRS